MSDIDDTKKAARNFIVPLGGTPQQTATEELVFTSGKVRWSIIDDVTSSLTKALTSRLAARADQVVALERKVAGLMRLIGRTTISHADAVDYELLPTLKELGWHMATDQRLVWEAPSVIETRELRRRLAERDTSLMRAVGKRA